MFDWIYILFFITLSQSILFFILFGKNILSPSVIVALMFSLSEFIAILNDNWGHPISELTTFVIISTIFTIAVGEALALSLTPKRNINVNYTLLSDLNINNKKLFLVILLQFFILIYYYNALKDIAPFGDNIIAEARNARLNGELLDKKATWLKNFSYIFAYIFSFVFLYKYVFFNKKHLLFIIPSIIYLATTTLEGNRLELIFMITFWIIIGSCFYLQKNNWNSKCNIKIIKNAFFVFIIFLGLFVFLGSFKYANIMDNALHHIGFYIGMSIPSLDEYLIDGRIPNEYFGEHTLISFYMFISRFSGVVYDMSPHLDFVCFNDTCGNVYTFIGRYHRDFGYFGVYFIVFIIGFFYRIFFEFVKNKNDFSILLFALLYSPMFNVAIDDVFFFKFASIGYLVLIFLMYISYRILITRKTL
ncbi:oligosaccharide repeat unit polymerase [Campylobacter sp. JMF_02 ED1]|uniref:O-antigen polymerase n=1 Tax=unclassified Campylobacter TaxID=2593542 RepID=UPI0022E9ECCE|nr:MULTISPECIES: O-antigen polymerase [unclassified Campylobacter]MDA3048778.1 oligosaccharide repeat unit polymerase [Campylobacter sp. JMF_15 NE4]MDA3050510.1 oligosaccharide repeat unit polymerase [Campylobacter sp. JMF_02 ED1]